MPTATIIGGGLAGLAAAAALADRGFTVTLLESRPRLGGRASSFVDPATGETIDNCQHVAMGCCTNFQAFCRLVGIEHHFRTEEQLHFIGPDGRQYPWRAAPLPAPLHLLPAFFQLGDLTLTQKLTAARALRALAQERSQASPKKPGISAPTTESFANWLRRRHQPPEVIEGFWEVVLVSALSESMDRIDVGYARKVFVDGFLANRDGWKVIVPRRPLDEIYEPVQRWLEQRGATVRLSAGVERLEFDGPRATAAVLRNGERLTADHFIVAVPWDRIDSLLDALPRSPASPKKPGISHPTESAPISSVHLWFDRPITSLPHAVFIGKTCQWLFQREVGPAVPAEPLNTAHQTPTAGPAVPAAPTIHSQSAQADAALHAPISTDPHRTFYYQIVVSASRQFLEMPTADAIEHVRRELASVWPVVNEATLLRGRVVTEHKAVFSPLPGIDQLRPPQQTAIPNLQLAGDWTQTGWPATMEGAVKSGFLAAEAILKQHDQPGPVVAPALKVSTLARLTMGL